MSEKCIYCKKNEAGEAKDISFSHQGIAFVGFKDGSTCEKCEQKFMIERFKTIGQEIIHFDKDRLKIDWHGFKKNEKRYMRALMDVGVLSHKAKGNWIVVDLQPAGLLPTTPGGPLFFTKREDIAEYARVEFSDTFFAWSIWQIGEVVSRNQVAKGGRR